MARSSRPDEIDPEGCRKYGKNILLRMSSPLWVTYPFPCNPGSGGSLPGSPGRLHSKLAYAAKGRLGWLHLLPVNTQ
jgi:hypothetical protein